MIISNINSKVMDKYPLTNFERYGTIMRGVGYDIANSLILSDEEKNILIKACENYFYQNRSFTKQERYLLWKVRKLYHIRNSGLCYQAEPSSFFDRLLG